MNNFERIGNAVFAMILFSAAWAVCIQLVLGMFAFVQNDFQGIGERRMAQIFADYLPLAIFCAGVHLSLYDEEAKGKADDK